MVKKNNNTKKKKNQITRKYQKSSNRGRPRKKSKKKKFAGLSRLITFLFVSITVLLITIVFFVFFIFPRYLNHKVKNSLVSLYQPVLFEESENNLILKLKSRPTEKGQKKVYFQIKKKYGLDVQFIRIKSSGTKGINQLVFRKNNKLFKDVNEVYIYWDTQLDKIEKQQPQIIKKSKNSHYEMVENKRRMEKEEVLNKPQVQSFKYSHYREHPEYPGEVVQIAIVIDDVGYSYNSTFSFLTLGFPVTFAIIPGLSKSKEFYQLFNDYGYETILHIPMEPLKGLKYVEKNAINTFMNDEQIIQQMSHFLNEYPLVVGANNHMGSKAVMNARIMNIVMKQLYMDNKFWLDSMTNLNSVTHEIALIYNLKYYKRDVFLDNNKDLESIRKSMKKLIEIAKLRKQAVGIGHIQTKKLVIVLKEYYNKKEQLGIEFVALSQLNQERILSSNK